MITQQLAILTMDYEHLSDIYLEVLAYNINSSVTQGYNIVCKPKYPSVSVFINFHSVSKHQTSKKYFLPYTQCSALEFVMLQLPHDDLYT